MELTYEDALTLFRSWKQSKSLPTLEVRFQISSLAVIHARCEEIEISEDTLTLCFGRVAWGNFQLNLPLREALIIVLTPDDESQGMPPSNDDLFTRKVLFKFSLRQENDGCLIIERAPGDHLVIPSYGKLDFAATPSNDAAA